MPVVNVTLKNQSAGKEELEKAKKTAQEQGGTDIQDYKLIKGFTVNFPADKVSTLESNEHVNVEHDSEFTTQ
ncbi:MAG: hypothetical protein M1819_006388 [Sarea resinae]|nr:MAG: hypothetical protein M1819_006388 [Sarea resinae]